MKIAIVCFNINWPTGGPRLIFSLAGSLARLGHKVVIYTPEFTGEYFKELWQGLDIRVIPPKKKFIWEGRPGFFKWIKRKIEQERLHIDTARRIANAIDLDIDILNLHDYAYRVGYFYRKRNPKVKIIWNSNDPPYSYLPKSNLLKDTLSRLYNFYRDVSSRKYFKAIDKIAVLDVYNKEWCKKRGLGAEIIYLGVDFEKFYLPLRNFKEKAKRKEARLMGLGALNAYRRYEDTINAVKFLRDWGYNVTLKIICNDAWQESEHRKELLNLVEKNDLKKFVTLQFEGVHHEELMEAFKESDIFVYAVYLPPPRHGFGFSIAVLEAIAAGLPVILCNTTTSEEVLSDGETALFVRPMSPHDIAEKVKFLVDNPDVYMKIAEAGQKLVKENFSLEKYAQNILKLTAV